MDETRCKYRIARHLAFAAAFHCVAACAEEALPRTNPSTGSLRSLLSNGWEDVPAGPPQVTAQPEIFRPPAQIIEVAEPLISEPMSKRENRPTDPLEPGSTTDSRSSRPEIVRPKRSLLAVPRPTLPAVPKTTAASKSDIPSQPISIQSPPVAVGKTAVSLAELIRSRKQSRNRPATAVSLAPEPLIDSELTTPDVHHFTLGERNANNELLGRDPAPTVEVVEATRSETESAWKIDSPSPVAREQVTEQVQEEVAEELPPGRKDRSVAGLSYRADRAAADLRSELPSIENREAKDDAKRHLLPGDARSEVRFGSSELRRRATESLLSAQHSWRHRALHSAKHYAIEAVRSLVAMRDAQDGGTQHAKCLKIASDAMRESADFYSSPSANDPSGLARLVNGHLTKVLKTGRLDNVSRHQATEIYLATAKRNLVAALQGSREASDALVMLSRIEPMIARPSDPYAAAVALMLQQAAVEVDPSNAVAHGELGSGLLQYDLVAQAVVALRRSVEIQPSQSGYQQLLDASRRLGDDDLAQQCIESLDYKSVPADIAVRQLEPNQFAARYQLSSDESLISEMPGQQTSAVTAASAESPMISRAKTWLLFGRRL